MRKRLLSLFVVALLCAAPMLSGCAAQSPAATPSPVLTPVLSASPSLAPEASSAPQQSAAPTAAPSPDSDTASVTALVRGFGKVLKDVSLLDTAGVASAMEKAYDSYVTPELLKVWVENPSQAPGRTVSSPWPDHIDIYDVRKESDTAYTVSGQIVELTSASAEAAARRGIILQVSKQADGSYLISEVTLGEYAQKNPVVYKNDEFGFAFYLPANWEGYTVFTEQWTGTPVNGGPAQAGPKLTLRSPKWMEEKPYQDIPILVFTKDQWAQVSAEELSVSAAPIPPTVLGANAQYVFALPTRYNFAYPEGYKDVENIIAGQPLWPIG